MKFIADENIAPETIEFIRNLGYDIIDIYQANLDGYKDLEIIDFAEKHNKGIISYDLDFGEIYYFSARRKFGIIILRIHPQIPARANRLLEILLKFNPSFKPHLANALVVINERNIRIRYR
jgi:predicted nuclease of predicted toxin-antitoxin system